MLKSVLNVRDLALPLPSRLSAFQNQKALLENANNIKKNPVPPGTIKQLSTRYIDTTDSFEQAKALYVYFKGSYGFNSLEAAYKNASQYKEKSRRVFVLLESNGESVTLPPSSQTWSDTIVAESILDQDERIRQFLSDYGSHFILNINYGYRVAIEGKIDSTDSREQQEFFAALKAGIGKIKVGAQVSSENRTILTKDKVQINAEVTVGSITPDRPLILTGIDEISDFLKSLNSGTTQITPAPVTAKLFSYWSTLPRDTYPKLRSDFSRKPFAIAKSPYGVPEGTMLFWKPNISTDYETVEGSDPILRAPLGWSFCHEVMPGIAGSFLRVTDDGKKVGEVGGSTTHDHQARSGSNDKKRGSSKEHGSVADFADSSHTHGITVKATETLPPFYLAMCIIKDS
uniref:MACPF domain-containing protein n=1 Tax=Rheinheimera sp. BAL341 TaxID=1708203 RepID=A0A486XJE2_9GAMM